ncbi:hypothetical protein B0O99DRAFT_693194 [Bisporella sp. PMI_857]|nr:hypothetical protein B0O99DRAFT_693194 [Bisporella sp. PMI_857]
MFGLKNVLQISLSAILLAQSISAAPKRDKWQMINVDGSGTDTTYQQFVAHSVFELSTTQKNPRVLTDSVEVILAPRARMVAVTYWPTGANKGWFVSDIPKGNVKNKTLAADGSWTMAEAAAGLPADATTYPPGTVTVVWGLRSQDFEKDADSLSANTYKPTKGFEGGHRIPMCSRGNADLGDRIPTCQVVEAALGVSN